MMYLDQLHQFKLKTVRLVDSKFGTAEEVERQSIERQKTYIQTRRWVDLVSDDQPGLTALVSLGIRLIKAEDSESEDPYTYYSLEAKYAVEFELEKEARDDFDKSFLDKFVDATPINIVWPFWRENIFSTLRSASLPTPEVPLMPAVFQSDTTDADGPENGDPEA